jgi:predicted membrane-bound spermidine synthase
MSARLNRFVLLVVVFFSGMTSLAVELSASRLVAPYFGDSLFIWANLIGAELIYLTIGYTLGGRLADRKPSATRLYTIVASAGALIALVPLLARPILSLSLLGFSNLDVGAFVGSLIGINVLLAAPVILLGMVTPFAIRLEITKLDKAGKTAGQIYALSTVGSIIGTFAPVFVLIPTIGTARTFVTFGVILCACALVGLVAVGARAPLSRVALPTSLILSFCIIGVALPTQIKPGFDGQLVVEKESLYNYIQVVRNGGWYELVLNEGQAIHSLYNPLYNVTGGEWEYFLAAPLFNAPPYTTADLHSACIIGLGAGSIPRNIDDTYGPIPMDGVEIDPEIVALGRQYFAMNEPNLHVITQDGRFFLELTHKKYDMIAIDAYQQPYIPFQLTTKEFFQLTRQHLTPHGVVAINTGRAGNDFRLVDALAATMHSVFKNVFVYDVVGEANSIVVGMNDDNAQLTNLAINAQLLTQPDLITLADNVLSPASNLRQGATGGLIFTDDRAPVESLIDQIILGYLRNNGNNGAP